MFVSGEATNPPAQLPQTLEEYCVPCSPGLATLMCNPSLVCKLIDSLATFHQALCPLGSPTHCGSRSSQIWNFSQPRTPGARPFWARGDVGEFMGLIPEWKLELVSLGSHLGSWTETRLHIYLSPTTAQCNVGKLVHQQHQSRMMQ